jgi:hypothetical protein
MEAPEKRGMKIGGPGPLCSQGERNAQVRFRLRLSDRFENAYRGCRKLCRRTASTQNHFTGESGPPLNLT